MSKEDTDEIGGPLDDSNEESTEFPTEVSPLSHAPDQAGGKDLLKVLVIVWTAETVMGFVTMVVSSMVGGEPLLPGTSYIDWRVFLATFSISSAILVWACWCFACERYDRSLSDGLFFIPVSQKNILAGALVGLIAAAVGITIPDLSASKETPLVAQLFLQPSSENPGTFELIYPMLLVPILAAVVEEIYYRGFLYSIFDRMIGSNWTFVIISAWFGLVHGPQIGNNWAALAVVIAVGILLTWLRRNYKSIWPSIVCHVAYNSTLVLVMVFSSGQE